MEDNRNVQRDLARDQLEMQQRPGTSARLSIYGYRTNGLPMKVISMQTFCECQSDMSVNTQPFDSRDACIQAPCGILHEWNDDPRQLAARHVVY